MKEYPAIIGKKPKDYTEEDIEEAILYLFKNKTLKEIRKFQVLNYKQCQLAYNQNNEEALKNLQRMGDIYTSVVDRISFKGE